MPDEWLTTNEAAEISGYHPEYLRKLLQSGKLAGKKFGPTWQVSRSALVEYVDQMNSKGKRRGPKSRNSTT